MQSGHGVITLLSKRMSKRVQLTGFSKSWWTCDLPEHPDHFSTYSKPEYELSRHALFTGCETGLATYSLTASCIVLFQYTVRHSVVSSSIVFVHNKENTKLVASPGHCRVVFYPWECAVGVHLCKCYVNIAVICKYYSSYPGHATNIRCRSAGTPVVFHSARRQ